MKKLVLILSMVMVLLSNVLSLATSEGSEEQRKAAEADVESVQQETTATEKTEEKELTPASEKILNNMSKKDRKIAEYTDKYNEKSYAYTAYYLDLVQLYSIPVCIIGMTIGAFNYFIIGEKKLDKKEKGFSFIMAFICGLVFFQVLPFVFALLVAGK